jgi:hypothetical protein
MSSEGTSRGVPWKAIGGVLAGLAALATIIGFIQREASGSGSSQHLAATQSPPVTATSLGPTQSPPHSQGPAAAPSPTITYQTVSFLALCNAPGVNPYGLNGCSTPMYDQVGGHVETWAATADANIQPEQVLTFPPTTCRSLTLQVGFNAALDAPGGGLPPGLKMTVTVAQSGSAAPKSITVRSDEVGTLFVKLKGGPWTISTIANQLTGGSWNIYVGGHASCATATGVS